MRDACLLYSELLGIYFNTFLYFTLHVVLPPASFWAWSLPLCSVLPVGESGKAQRLFFLQIDHTVENDRAGNSLIRSSLLRSTNHFAQIKWATVSESLRSLKTNEWPWANRSGRTEEMSKRERIAQVAQDKWAIMSDSLRSLRGNERMSASVKNVC